MIFENLEVRQEESLMDMAYLKRRYLRNQSQSG